jgi:hypothetical protein
MFKKLLNQAWLWPITITTALICLVFRGIVTHHSTHLLDLFDFPYYAWVLDHALDFFTFQPHSSFFTTNAFFPFTNSYFFSDLLLPQALVGLIPYLLGFNPITITNFIVVGTLILNAIAAVWLWQARFKNTWSLTLATLTTTLSPFIFTQRGHLQMMTLWPMLLVVGILLRKKSLGWKLGILVGLLWVLQLMASFYLSIFLLFVIGWDWLVTTYKEKDLRTHIPFLATFGMTCALLGGPILIKYYQVKQQYSIATATNEYITYAAHPSDYLFITFPTFGQQLTEPWQRFNHHGIGEIAAYPGTAMLLLALFSLVKIKKNKQTIQFQFATDKDTLFFLGLMTMGFIFSLGPRLSFNGSYAHLPLPYLLLLKIIPLLESIRATARWSLLLYLGVTYFAAKTLETLKLKKQWQFLPLIVIIGYVFEMVPLQLSAEPVSAALDNNHPITRLCQQPTTLAIFPFTEQHLEASLTTNLARKTQELLRSTIHHCRLVNGYGGFEPPGYQQLEQQLNYAIGTDLNSFWHILRDNQVKVVMIDSHYLNPKSKVKVDTFFADYALSNMQQPPITILDQQPGSWYLVEVNTYDTFEAAPNNTQ